jgi:histidinol-phosphatase (PHP family)
MQENYLKQELYALMYNDASIFEFIQSGSLDGIWYWDLENIQNEWMSPKFWTTLGYDPNSRNHLASEWQDIIFQEDLKLAIENFEKHCADPNQPYDQIVRYKHRNGSTVWIRCRGLAIRDEKGKAIRMLGAHTDITDLKVIEKEISRLTKEYETVFNGTQDAIFLVNVLENGEFRYVRNNIAHQSKTGILLEQIRDKTPQELLGKEMGDVVAENYKKCIVSKRDITYEEELSLPAGNHIWLTTLTPIVVDDKVSQIVGSSTDITERKKIEIELEIQANYDNLTGLPNRRMLLERLERVIVESERNHSQFALLYIDLDNFKEINDNYGHAVGDEVLITVGKRIQTCIRKSDIVARMGGDEYSALIRDVEDNMAISYIVEKIHKAVREVMHIGDSECYVNSSIGVTIYPGNGEDSETLLRNADSIMYQVKRNGRGGFEFSDNKKIEITFDFNQLKQL